MRGKDEEDVQLAEEGHAGARQAAGEDRLQAQDAEERQGHRQSRPQVGQLFVSPVRNFPPIGSCERERTPTKAKPKEGIPVFLGSLNPPGVI